MAVNVEQKTDAAKPLHPEIAAFLKDKGDNWVIAAIVEGSIGYFDPHGAKRTLDRYKAGDRQNFCERCYCLYGADLEKMILDDTRKFAYYETSCPESFQRVIKFIEAWASRPEEPFGGTTSMMYPTIV